MILGPLRWRKTMGLKRGVMMFYRQDRKTEIIPCDSPDEASGSWALD
jgi:hypothetical protein